MVDTFAGIMTKNPSFGGCQLDSQRGGVPFARIVMVRILSDQQSQLVLQAAQIQTQFQCHSTFGAVIPTLEPLLHSLIVCESALV